MASGFSIVRRGRKRPAAAQPAPQAAQGQARQAAAAVRPLVSVSTVRRRTGPLGLRLLPATIFVAALMLSVRVVDMFDAQDPALTIDVGGAPAEAQAVAPTPPDAKPGTPEADAAAGAEPAAASAAQPPVDRPLERGQFRAPDMPPQDERDQPIDISKLTRGEVAVLQRLSERRRELDTRETSVDERERLLAAMETRIDEKIAQLRSIQTEVESLLGKVGAAEEAEYQRLVKIYEVMEPEDAARIFQGLDMPVLMQVVERMKERRTAPILAQMDPVRARAVTTQLAERRKLPPGAEGAAEDGALANPADPGTGN
ncbi:hypothetical protein P7L78_12685 [Tistrella bauzanensis]|uniref:MotE family protein n=1 Tax=Tistrella TaxID=171436 RepID=UPI0031F63B43